jgi:hypothetical protein
MKLKGVFLAFLFLLHISVPAQVKPAKSAERQAFMQALTRTNISFTYPPDFNEIKVPNDENLSFDYGLKLRDKEFEVWYIVNNLKGDWASYEDSKNDPERVQEIPDSLYRKICRAHAIGLSGGDYTTVDMPDNDLRKQFNADVGKAYALNLYDSPITKHYKYALLLMVQKNKKANVLMLFLSNDNGPEFYNNVNKAYNSIRFR